MANEEQLAILKQGVEAWNKWRHANPRIRPDLGEAVLMEAGLSGANQKLRALLAVFSSTLVRSSKPLAKAQQKASRLQRDVSPPHPIGNVTSIFLLSLPAAYPRCCESQPVFC